MPPSDSPNRPTSAIADLLSRLHIGHAVEILEEFEPERRQRISAATRSVMDSCGCRVTPTWKARSVD